MQQSADRGGVEKHEEKEMQVGWGLVGRGILLHRDAHGGTPIMEEPSSKPMTHLVLYIILGTHHHAHVHTHPQFLVILSKYSSSEPF